MARLVSLNKVQKCFLVFQQAKLPCVGGIGTIIMIGIKILLYAYVFLRGVLCLSALALSSHREVHLSRREGKAGVGTLLYH